MVAAPVATPAAAAPPLPALPLARFALYLGLAVVLHCVDLWLERTFPHPKASSRPDLDWLPHGVFLATMLGSGGLAFFFGPRAPRRALVFGAGASIALAAFLLRPVDIAVVGGVIVATWLVARLPVPLLARLALVLAALAVPVWMRTGGLGRDVTLLVLNLSSLEAGLWAILLMRACLYQVECRRLRPEDRSLVLYAGSFTLLPLCGISLAPPVPYGQLLGQYGTADPDENLRQGLDLLALGIVLEWLDIIAVSPLLDDALRPFTIAAAQGIPVAAGVEQRLIWGAALLLQFPHVYLRLAGPIFRLVGNLRLLGFNLPAGFDRPFLAWNLVEFWKRWNHFFRDTALILFYMPALGAVRRRVSLPVAVTIAVGACFAGEVLLREILEVFMRLPPGMWTVGHFGREAGRLGFIGVLTTISVFFVARRAARGGAGVPGWGARLRGMALTMGLLATVNAFWYTARAATTPERLWVALRVLFGG
ncbi:MAG TPA: hypothetical protein VGQ83_16940 [Polyangia bacterium]|jgi:hypothetical protein